MRKLGWFGLDDQRVRGRKALGVAYVLVGITWITAGVFGSIHATGTTNYVQVGIGIVWLLGGVGWFWRIKRWQRSTERSNRAAGPDHVNPAN